MLNEERIKEITKIALMGSNNNLHEDVCKAIKHALIIVQVLAVQVEMKAIKADVCKMKAKNESASALGLQSWPYSVDCFQQKVDTLRDINSQVEALMKALVALGHDCKGEIKKLN